MMNLYLTVSTLCALLLLSRMPDLKDPDDWLLALVVSAFPLANAVVAAICVAMYLLEWHDAKQVRLEEAESALLKHSQI